MTAATRRRYSVKKKKSNSIVGPTSIKWMVGLFLVLLGIIIIYQSKDYLLYYFSFKSKHSQLTATERKREDAIGNKDEREDTPIFHLCFILFVGHGVLHI